MVVEETELEEELEEEEVPDEFHPKVRWAIPHRVDQVTFIGKEVVAVAHDLYIVFMNVRTGLELVYTADGPERGDGVDALAGHRTNMFAFTEKVKHGRIFIMNYPNFQILIELKDNDVNRYKGLCLMEGELIAGFSGYPDYLITVWSWRLNQRLVCVPTGVVMRKQVFLPSHQHMLVCQCYGQNLIVWEVAPCFRRTFLMRRSKPDTKDWEITGAPLVSVCWASDGFLYACDAEGNLYGVASDGIHMVACQEWHNQDVKMSSVDPMVCPFGNGILLYGPDHRFRWLKKVDTPKPENNETEEKAAATKTDQKASAKKLEQKSETKPKPEAKVDLKTDQKGKDEKPKQKWRVAWERRLEEDDVLKLVSNSAADVAIAWTQTGCVLRINATTTLDEDGLDVRLFTYKMRNIVKVKLLAPDYKYVIVMNDQDEICAYETKRAEMRYRKKLGGTETSFQVSPVDPIVVVFGANGSNYGMALYEWNDVEMALQERAHVCLTHQIISRVVFSSNGRHLIAASMSAGHLFVYNVSEDYQLNLVRYSEVGRGLADCCLMQVGNEMRAFGLVLFSDKFVLGERVICINAVTGKDNKFAGKMKGPYCRLLPLAIKDTLLAIPFMSREFHLLKLSGEKGITITVRVGEIIESGHELKQFSGHRGVNGLFTFGFDGVGILRRPDKDLNEEFKLTLTHRYENGIKSAAIDASNRVMVHVGNNHTVAVTYRNGRRPDLQEEVRHEPIATVLMENVKTLRIFDADEKNYLDIQEEKKVREEAMDYAHQREEVVRTFTAIQKQLVELLEENIREVPLHQLPLVDFNLHLELKKERMKQAEKEREEIRLTTEARIVAQDEVTAWIKKTCWDTMLTPRVKIFAIFSHYQVENFPVLPSQRENWAELQQAEQLRALEMENDDDVFRPWIEIFPETAAAGSKTCRKAISEVEEVEDKNKKELKDTKEVKADASFITDRTMEDLEEETVESEPYVLSGTATHKYVTVPAAMIPQTLSFSFLQMNMLYQLVKLNKLSDLRGSFHHMMIEIRDPVWRQEEEPIRLTRVLTEECTIPPWKSHISLPPPELKPKDDFRERALDEMMDGVLEKLWHEEIKKLIPKPQCMYDKEPEHWNEEDLRQVFDYEYKVKFRNEEREKYRRMLHAEYAALSKVLNEGIVKFNMKVKELWLTKLKADSVIGQESLNLMRLRRTNLDRVEAAEELEDLRDTIARFEKEVEMLQAEFALIQEQSNLCQVAYDALAHKDRQMDRSFKNQFADYPPIVVDSSYKYYKKRPKWSQRGNMTPVVVYELCTAILTNTRPPLLHPDCVEYFKGIEQLDQIINMPAIMDEACWTTMCRLRRSKIENELRMKAQIMESALVDATMTTWNKALQARRNFLALCASRMQLHRENEQITAINRTIQLVLPAGQVEVITTGHMEDFEDAMLLPRDDVEEINKLILKVGAIKLRLLRRQIEFRKLILAKEWEHAQMKMKLRHMQQELYSYGKLKIVKELQWFLKNKEKGYTDENDYQRLEKEMQATKVTVERVLTDSAQHAEELQVKISKTDTAAKNLQNLLDRLHLYVSEKRANEDALEPIRIRRIFKKRMETLVTRSRLVRDVQANHTRIVLLQTELELLHRAGAAASQDVPHARALPDLLLALSNNHTRIVLLQTELELLRLKTYPTLARFQTFC
ncbi:cilia- and flagella-associated protein 43 [Phthorimaea operculella]|nr:cilia- and flagella-associated protein 43 [Phthorimaea operculella]